MLLTFRTAAAALFVATAFLVLVASAGAADDTFVPFVTDFPRSTVPSTIDPSADPASSGVSWSSIGIGGVGVLLGIALGVFAVTRRERRAALA